MSDHFSSVENFDELIRVLRRRYQLWVSDDLAQLKGFLAGFCSARPQVAHARLAEFEGFLASSSNGADDRVESWPVAIRRRSPTCVSEIPQFFQHYELFCGKQSTEVEVVQLSETARALFSRQDELGFASRGIPAPIAVSVWQSEYWGVLIRHELENRSILYEISVDSLKRAMELLARYQSS